jgi:uncharacterized protein YwqG
MFPYQMPELPPVLAPFAEIIRLHWKPFLKIVRAEEGGRPWQSRLGGQIPYWPADFTYPRNPDDEPLLFLLQLNFADMPPLPGFPTQGLLQLFVDWGQGQFLHYESKAMGHYHPDLCTDPELLLDAASVNALLYNHTKPLPMPGAVAKSVKNPGPLAFQPASAPPDETDYLYEIMFPEHARLPQSAEYESSDNPKEEEKRKLAAYHRSPAKEYYRLTEAGLCSTVGGYARFPQRDDPRQYLPQGHDWMVLVKLMEEPDFGMRWGDVQELHVFIQRQALLQHDFSNLWLKLAS